MKKFIIFLILANVSLLCGCNQSNDVKNHVINDEGVVFKEFPKSTDDYREDIRPIMNQIIQKYGTEEWRICVLVNEIHGHLGIYSLVGAKMGLRAREYFNVGTHELDLVSYAGLTPPLSCLNDGLQVSTGATLGRGTINISKDSLLPEATFSFNGKSIRLILKQKYWEIIKNELKLGSEKYGNGTQADWDYSRKCGIKYWLEWDRHNIFDIKEIN